MEKVTVTTTTTHIDDQGIHRKPGESYVTAKNYAEIRKGLSLVEFDGEGKKPTGQPLLYAGVNADSGATTTAIVDSEDGKMVPVNKAALEAGKAKANAKADASAKSVKAAAKKAAPKKAVKEKVETPQPQPEKQEGVFPGSPATTE